MKRTSGEPAAGVELFVKRDAKAEAWDGLERLRTDAAGEAHLAGAAPSTLRVGPLRDFYDNLRDFSIDWPAHEQLGYLQTRTVEQNGTVLWDLKEDNVGGLPRPYERWTRLPLGEFVLKAETGSGLTGAVEFSVTYLGVEQERVQLSLQ